MIGNLWFALLAFILGAGLTYLRMAGSATRQVPKPVPRRLVMGGIIPGVVDPPAAGMPTDAGQEWTILAGAATSEATEATAAGSAAAAAEQPEAEIAEASIRAADQTVAAVQPLEPPWPLEADGPVAESPIPAAAEQSTSPTDGEPMAARLLSQDPEPAGAAEASREPPAPLERKIAAGATDEPPTSSWWAAAFDRGDPGPYPGPLRYASAWPPAGSRVLEVDDEFAAAWGAGAAASAASAALFGTAGRASRASGPAQAGPEPAPAVGAPPEPTVVGVDEPDRSAAEESGPAQTESSRGGIKGNRDSMLYHTPDSPWYGRTKAEEWFATEEEALGAGFERWDSRTKRPRT